MAARDAEKLYYASGSTNARDSIGKHDATATDREYWCYSREYSPFKAAMAVLGSGNDNIFGDKHADIPAAINEGYRLLQAATDIKSVEGLGGMAAPTPGTNTASETDKNQFVPGISGKITRDRRIPQPFTLRWDWDNSKAMHVNLAIDSSKYAFMELSLSAIKDPNIWQKKGIDAPNMAYQDRLINLNKISGYSKTDFENAKDKEAYKKTIGEKIRNNWVIAR